MQTIPLPCGEGVFVHLDQVGPATVSLYFENVHYSNPKFDHRRTIAVLAQREYLIFVQLTIPPPSGLIL